MTAAKAANLPEGSVVVIKSPKGPYDSSAVTLTRNGDSTWPWTSGNAGPIYSDYGVQDALDSGAATVQREGWPE